MNNVIAIKQSFAMGEGFDIRKTAVFEIPLDMTIKDMLKMIITDGTKKEAFEYKRIYKDEDVIIKLPIELIYQTRQFNPKTNSFFCEFTGLLEESEAPNE